MSNMEYEIRNMEKKTAKFSSSNFHYFAQECK